MLLDAFAVDLLSCLIGVAAPTLFWCMGMAPFGWPSLILTTAAIVGLRFKLPIVQPDPVDRSSWALVTGSNSGIGLDIAVELSKFQNVILTGRDRTRLDEAASLIRQTSPDAQVVSITKDLTAAGAARELYEEAKKVGRIDTLVNNAGFGYSEPFAFEPEADIENMLSVNVTTLTQLTRYFLPEMIERRRGRVLNVASTAGFCPGPGMSLYSATKAYVVSLSQGLFLETRGTGVLVSCLCPGATNTRFEGIAGNDQSVLFKHTPVMTSKAVAQAAVVGMRRGDRLIFPGPNASTYWASKLLPGAPFLALTKIILSKPAGSKKQG